MATTRSNRYQYLEPRPDSNSRQLFLKGRRIRAAIMRIAIDENMSNQRLATRLRAAGHGVLLATDVGLIPASDARAHLGCW